MLGYIVLLFSLPNYARSVGLTAQQGCKAYFHIKLLLSSMGAVSGVVVTHLLSQLALEIAPKLWIDKLSTRA
jgi:hypothetical protein